MGNYYWILNMISKGQKDSAIKEITKILKADPKDVEAWSLLAAAVDEPAKKADCYRQILRIDPANEHAQSSLRALQAPPGAVGEKKAPKIEIAPVAPMIEPAPAPAEPKFASPKDEPKSTPNQARELLEKGKNEIRSGNISAGKEWIRQAVQLNPDNDEAWIEYIQSANTDEFRLKIVQRWLAYAPGNERARQAMEELQSAATGAGKPAGMAKEKPQKRAQTGGPLFVLRAFFLGIAIEVIVIVLAQAPRYLVLGPFRETPTTPPEAIAMIFTIALSFAALGVLWYLLDHAWSPRIHFPLLTFMIQLVVLLTPVSWFFIGKGALHIINKRREKQRQ